MASPTRPINLSIYVCWPAPWWKVGRYDTGRDKVCGSTKVIGREGRKRRRKMKRQKQRKKKKFLVHFPRSLSYCCACTWCGWCGCSCGLGDGVECELVMRSEGDEKWRRRARWTLIDWPWVLRRWPCHQRACHQHFLVVGRRSKV